MLLYIIEVVKMYEEEEEEERGEGFFDMIISGLINTFAELTVYVVLLPFIALFESIFGHERDEEDEDDD